jgi:DNA-binding response OmpR family regulator
MELGFFRYLTKPIVVTEFMATLDEALKRAETIQAGNGNGNGNGDKS